MIFYRHFRAKVDALVVEMEQQAIKLVDFAHGERAMTHETCRAHEPARRASARSRRSTSSR